MELPDTLQRLYRHWPQHVTRPDTLRTGEIVFTSTHLHEQIAAFIRERTRIWEKRQSGATPPFTADPVLARYRFCNILRELDRQTIEYHTLLAPLQDDFPLWLLNMFYARLVARPETLRATGLLSFSACENETLLAKLRALPRPRYGTPYVFPVSTILRSNTPTRELFVAQHLPLVMRDVALEIAAWNGKGVADGVARILPIFGFNHHFLWTEVLIDVAYQYPERIDLFKRFPVGPGALPTFRRINPDVAPEELALRLGALQVPSGLTIGGVPIRLSPENWEGIGCEFRKYTNLSAGTGRKRIFV